VLRGPSTAPATAPSPSATGRFTIDGRDEQFDPGRTRFAAGDMVIVNLSGRGDKDVHEAAELLGHGGGAPGARGPASGGAAEGGPQ